MYELKPDDKIRLNDVIVYKDGTQYCLDGGGYIGTLVGELLIQSAIKRIVRPGRPPEPKPITEPQVTYIGNTTVVCWPDGKINSAKPCKAQPKRNGRKEIKADKFDPMIGFLHCLAKKHYGSQYKKFIDAAQVQE